MTKFTREQETFSLFLLIIGLVFIFVGVYLWGIATVGFVFIGTAFTLPFVRIMIEQGNR